MIQTLVATLMWALVASLLIFRRKRTDRSITYAALTIAIAMTLNVDAVYETVDPLLGGTNIATLIADTLLMIGLFFLGRGVMHTGEYRPQLVRDEAGGGRKHHVGCGRADNDQVDVGGLHTCSLQGPLSGLQSQVTAVHTGIDKMPGLDACPFDDPVFARLNTFGRQLCHQISIGQTPGRQKTAGAGDA